MRYKSNSLHNRTLDHEKKIYGIYADHEEKWSADEIQTLLTWVSEEDKLASKSARCFGTLFQRNWDGVRTKLWKILMNYKHNENHRLQKNRDAQPLLLYDLGVIAAGFSRQGEKYRAQDVLRIAKLLGRDPKQLQRKIDSYCGEKRIMGLFATYTGKNVSIAEVKHCFKADYVERLMNSVRRLFEANKYKITKTGIV